MNEKLIKIQNELSVPKNQRNTFGNYNYRSCEDILEAVKPLLEKEHLLLTITDELVNIGERYYIKATCRILGSLGTNPPAGLNVPVGYNDYIETTGYAREEETKKGMDGSQITGASSSYARKYALNAMFLIDDTKDSDTTNTHQEATTSPSKAVSAPNSTDAPGCPKCGGQMWDNRGKKTNPKAPDFKCKTCDGVIWPPKDSFPHYDSEGNGQTEEQYEEYVNQEEINLEDVPFK